MLIVVQLVVQLCTTNAQKIEANGQFTPTTPTRLNSTVELNRVVRVNRILTTRLNCRRLSPTVDLNELAVMESEL